MRYGLTIVSDLVHRRLGQVSVMGKGVRLVVALLFTALLINVLMVIVRRKASSKYHPSNLANTYSGEKTLGPRPTLRPTLVVNHTAVPTENPQLLTDAKLRQNTRFSRLGSQLDLDYARMCPPDSIMLSSDWQQSVPQHQGCPTLFIVGARKGGSTSLYTYVSQHPEFEGVLLDKGPKAGETFYFTSHWSKWNWAEYMSIFKHAKSSMTGESSVDNMVDCNVPRRLWKACGKQAKIVFLFREPVKRFESNFHIRIAEHRKYKPSAEYPVSTVVDDEMNTFLKALTDRGHKMEGIDHSWGTFRCLFPAAKNMIFEGVYFVHLMNWLCNFPPENILILNSEEFYNNSQSILADVFEFLGLSPLDYNTLTSITSTVYNPGREYFPPHQCLGEVNKEKMMTIYKLSNQALFKLLNWDNVGWNNIA